MFEDKDMIKFNKIIGREESMDLLDSSEFLEDFSTNKAPKEINIKVKTQKMKGIEREKKVPATKTRNSEYFVKASNHFELKKAGSFDLKHKNDTNKVEKKLFEEIG